MKSAWNHSKISGPYDDDDGRNAFWDDVPGTIGNKVYSGDNGGAHLVVDKCIDFLGAADVEEDEMFHAKLLVAPALKAFKAGRCKPDETLVGSSWCRRSNIRYDEPTGARAKAWCLLTREIERRFCVNENAPGFRPGPRKTFLFTSKRLSLKYDRLVSSFAFNFNLRRYIKAELTSAHVDKVALLRHSDDLGTRCGGAG